MVFSIKPKIPISLFEFRIAKEVQDQDQSATRDSILKASLYVIRNSPLSPFVALWRHAFFMGHTVYDPVRCFVVFDDGIRAVLERASCAIAAGFMFGCAV